MTTTTMTMINTTTVMMITTTTMITMMMTEWSDFLWSNWPLIILHQNLDRLIRVCMNRNFLICRLNAEKFKFLERALTDKTEHRGRVCTILASYSPGLGSTFLPRDRISWLVSYLKVGDNPPFPHPFQFINQQSITG
jgi:hypothetical protein